MQDEHAVDGETPAEVIPCLPDETAEDVSDRELDKIVEDTFPASDPIPVLGTIALATENHEKTPPIPEPSTKNR